MESIGRVHRLLARYAPEFCVGVLAGSDVQERIRRVVHTAEGNRPTRSCPLHPVLVLWLVLCLPLQRALSIANVFVLILSAWRSRLRGLPLRPVSDGALAHARARLGVAPVRALFEDLAADVEPAASFHGRRVWAMDGVHLTVPDTPANEARFGRPGSSRGRSAFPQIHLVTLASTRTVRPDANLDPRVASRIELAGGSPAAVSAAAPRSRPQASGEIPPPERGVRCPHEVDWSRGGEQLRGPNAKA